MSLKPGMYQDLKVERDSPYGYFLSDGNEDVLLHYSELNHETVNIGDTIEVYLFSDHKGRISATLNRPIIAMGEADFLEVTDFQRNIGFFLDNGIGKNILLPTKQLPGELSIWPKVGDKLFVTLDYDKEGRLLAQLIKTEEELFEYLRQSHEDLEEDPYIPKNKLIDGIVFHHFSVGVQVYLPEYMSIGFLHRSEQLQELRLGEQLKVRVTFIREDGRFNLAMKPLKVESQLEDADRILNVLQERNGAMPYWDKTPADIIETKFQLSKGAFKRALGKLMKEGLIYQEEGWTYLSKK